MLSKTATKTRKFGSMCNPVIRKMEQKTETMECSGDDIATYDGIKNKTLLFLFMALVGVGVFFILHNFTMSNASEFGGVINIVDEEDGIYNFSTNALEGIIVLVALVLSLILPLFAWLIRSTIPVTGVLYAIVEGYFVGAITEFLAPDYKWVSMVALILTITIVACMLFIYVRGIIKVTNKFKTVITAIFLTMALGSLVIFLLSFIPVLNPIISGAFSFMGSPIVGIVFSIIYIVMAALFLLVDFDTIKTCVENRMPKKLEWMAAFGLVYTVIYIYFKILSLILKIIQATKND